MQLSQSTFSLITLTHITQNPSLSGYWYSCTVSVVPPLHLYTCGLTCTPQLHSTVYSSACRRSIGYLGGQCGARSTSDPLQLRVEWWEREFALALGGRLHLQWRETATMSSLRFLRPSDSGGVAYSRGCGVFDGITILVEERDALPTSGLDARKAVHITCRSSLILQSMQ